jgi:signal transduction histidine kinase
VKRTNQLVTRFLEFAGPAKLDLGKGDINDTIRAAIDHFREAPRGESGEIELNQTLEEIPAFAYDKTLMESVFLNLLLNARDAMPDGGVISVTTRREGERAIIEVADAGSGIPEDKMQDIFNPFFTTKASGVGLGLAMVSKIVDSHRGTVSVENRPSNQGALFRIQIPMDLEPRRPPGNF